MKETSKLPDTRSPRQLTRDGNEPPSTWQINRGMERPPLCSLVLSAGFGSGRPALGPASGGALALPKRTSHETIRKTQVLPVQVAQKPNLHLTSEVITELKPNRRDQMGPTKALIIDSMGCLEVFVLITWQENF